MKVFLYCVQSTFVGVILANNKDEAKNKVSDRYIDYSDIIVVDPMDRDIIIDDVYEMNDLFNYHSIDEQKLRNNNREMKEELKRISNLINQLCE